MLQLDAAIIRCIQTSKSRALHHWTQCLVDVFHLFLSIELSGQKGSLTKTKTIRRLADEWKGLTDCMLRTSNNGKQHLPAYLRGRHEIHKFSNLRYARSIFKIMTRNSLLKERNCWKPTCRTHGGRERKGSVPRSENELSQKGWAVAGFSRPTWGSRA